MEQRVQRDAQARWAIVQRQMESGLSQVAFCSAEGLSLSSLQTWKRQFVREGRIAQARTAPVPAPAPATPWFTELAMPPTAGDSASSPRPTTESPAWQIELDLGGGVVLRIHRADRC